MQWMTHPIWCFWGDYIYEYASPRDATGLARVHALRAASWQYRRTTATATPCTKATRCCRQRTRLPMGVTWDDHEVRKRLRRRTRRDGDGDGDGDMPAFPAMRQAGWQALREHAPACRQPGAGVDALQVYRSLAWDAGAYPPARPRQFRDWQTCRRTAAVAQVVCALADCAAWVPPAHAAGRRTEQWLDARLAKPG